MATSVLDPVDYFATSFGFQENDVDRVVQITTFRAAATAYKARNYISLGYAAFFCWHDVKKALPYMTHGSLMNVIRYVVRRMYLPVSDPRHIAIDPRGLETDFPDLFQLGSPDARRARNRKRTDELVVFALTHPFWDQYASSVEFADDREYASYWLNASLEKVTPLLEDRRFLAGFDALCQNLVSYDGFMENVFIKTDYVLFPELGKHLSALALGELTHRVRNQ